MFLLTHNGNPLGSENSAGTDILQKVFGAPPENLAEFVQAEHPAALQPLQHLRQVAAELLRAEELEEHGRVYILPASFRVDESD